MGAGSALEVTLSMLLLDEGLRGFVTEYAFHETRQWRFDFAWPGLKVAAECEGGLYHNGRHNRARGYEADCDKYNAATLAGWNVYRFTSRQIQRGDAVNVIKKALEARRKEWQHENSQTPK